MFRWLVAVLSFNGVRWPYLLYSLLRRSVGKTDNYSAILFNSCRQMEWCLDLKRLTKPSFNLHLEILRFFVPFKLIIGNVGLSCSSNMLLLVLYEIYAIIVFSSFV